CEVVNEANAPVYHQLTTRDYGKALDFYREVFGWQTDTVSDTGEFRYGTAMFDGDPRRGGHALRPARGGRGPDGRHLQPVVVGLETPDCWTPCPLRKVSSSSRY